MAALFADLDPDDRVLALPIVDMETRRVGILTVDDALRILESAESEDQAHISGVEPLRRPYLTAPATESGALAGGLAAGSGHRCDADRAGAGGMKRLSPGLLLGVCTMAATVGAPRGAPSAERFLPVAAVLAQ